VQFYLDVDDVDDVVDHEALPARFRFGLDAIGYGSPVRVIGAKIARRGPGGPASARGYGERGVRVAVDEVGSGGIPDSRVQPSRHDHRRARVSRRVIGGERPPFADSLEPCVVDKRRRGPVKAPGWSDGTFVPFEHLRGFGSRSSSGRRGHRSHPPIQRRRGAPGRRADLATMDRPESATFEPGESRVPQFMHAS
jgi:hypothetical protein